MLPSLVYSLSAVFCLELPHSPSLDPVISLPGYAPSHHIAQHPVPAKHKLPIGLIGREDIKLLQSIAPRAITASRHTPYLELLWLLPLTARLP